MEINTFELSWVEFEKTVEVLEIRDAITLM